MYSRILPHIAIYQLLKLFRENQLVCFFCFIIRLGLFLQDKCLHKFTKCERRIVTSLVQNFMLRFLCQLRTYVRHCTLKKYAFFLRHPVFLADLKLTVNRKRNILSIQYLYYQYRQRTNLQTRYLRNKRVSEDLNRLKSEEIV